VVCLLEELKRVEWVVTMENSLLIVSAIESQFSIEVLMQIHP